MIQSKYFKKAITITVACAIMTTLLVGCGKKAEPVQTKSTTETTKESTKDATKDTDIKNQSSTEGDKSEENKPLDSTKTEIKAVKMDANMQKQLDTFFSNFSEAYVEPFEKGKVGDANLIRFGVLHVILNNDKLIEKKGENNVGYIKAENIDSATLYYFGEKPKKHGTVEGYTYEDGYYKFPRASGEAYTFSQIDKLDELGSDTYKAEVSIYKASSGFTGDSHGRLDAWKASGEDIPKLSQKINAVIKKINDNGKDRYLLMEYK